MKKPIFDKINRQIIREDNSFSANRMKFFISNKKVEKAFLKTGIGRALDQVVKYLNSKLL